MPAENVIITEQNTDYYIYRHNAYAQQHHSTDRCSNGNFIPICSHDSTHIDDTILTYLEIYLVG